MNFMAAVTICSDFGAQKIKSDTVSTVSASIMAQEKGCTVPQICLAWLLHQKMMLFPIITPTSESHIMENAAALDISLTDAEYSVLLNGMD